MQSPREGSPIVVPVAVIAMALASAMPWASPLFGQLGLVGFLPSRKWLG